MKSVDRITRYGRPSAPTATYLVKFGQSPKRAPLREQLPLAGRVPRVTRLLALAHRIDGMIRSGELQDWAEAARLVGVSRARMTQIANLLLLSPEINEGILMLPPVLSGHDPITERDLRVVTAHADWHTQHIAWTSLRNYSSKPPAL